jgi:hypothetical protein
MGLFSKKTLVCETCGKEYDARIAVGEHICPDCRKRKEKKQAEVQGYLNYSYAAGLRVYSEQDLDNIIAHRQEILEKYDSEPKLTRDEFRAAGDNYKKLSDEEAFEILKAKANTEIFDHVGSSLTSFFFVPTGYEKIVVDTKDIFAVGYLSDVNIESKGNEVILCALFTNDPYVPVIPLAVIGHLGFFEFSKSKKGRAHVESMLELLCPNLTYPVQELKKLKKQIKADGSVKGNIDYKFMLDLILMVESKSNIFNTKKMDYQTSIATLDMLAEHGYMLEDDIKKLLRMDKMFSSSFWQKQNEKYMAELYDNFLDKATEVLLTEAN